MKKIATILLALVSLTAMFGNTGCGSDPITKPSILDTAGTDTIVPRTIFNQMKVGLKLYDLAISDEASFAVYNVGTNTTFIYVSGNDITNGEADFNIKFPGNMTDTFTTHNEGGLVFECGTGTIGDIRRQEYSADNSALTAIVNEYGAVGERIKGTFSGVVKIGTNSVNLTGGKFDVLRRPNE